MADVLGVNRSFTARRWQQRGMDSPEVERQALAIAQRHDLPDIIARVLASRGIGLERVESFLAPRLRNVLQDPDRLLDMEKGVQRLVQAVQSGETVGLLADFDVDGATSAALLTRFLHSIGVRTLLHVPDRLRDGYGPNRAALAGLRERGCGLIITLDCGIAAIEVLGEAAEQGSDIVVVDHHISGPELPRAVAVINPNRIDESGLYTNLAAVGVTFLFVIALNRSLRQCGWYRDRQEPDLTTWLDLVALGTVCDVVPLDDINRALVTQGLKIMARRGNIGLRTLSDLAGLDRAPDSGHLGFILGPRINAAGRVGQSDLGARLLTTECGDEAETIARKLSMYNSERQELEAAVRRAAMQQADARMDDVPVVVVAGDGWHPGVIGIVAGRLRERYHRPACVISFDGDTGKGSCRSAPGLPIGAAVIAACQSGLLVAGGGHAMAAGFTIRREKVDAFRAFLSDRFSRVLGSGPVLASLGIDGLLAPGGVQRSLVDTLARLGPFGSGNPEPRFAVSSARVVRADVVGNDHVRCQLAGSDGSRINGIAFRAMENDLGPALLQGFGRNLHFAGRLRTNDWRGRRTVQLQIEDAAPAG